MLGEISRCSKTCRCRRRTDLRSAEGGCRHRLRVRPTTILRSNQLRRLAIGADLAPGVVEGDVWAKINQLPAVKNFPQGVEKMNLGNQKWQSELMFNFAIALISGVLLVFAVLVCSTAASWTVREHGLADPCAARRGGGAAFAGQPCRCSC